VNHQDVPPKPSSPPTAGLPRVPAAEYGVPAAEPPVRNQGQVHHPQGPGDGRRQGNRRILWKAFFAVVLLAVIGSLVWLVLWLNSSGDPAASEGAARGVLETTVTPRQHRYPCRARWSLPPMRWATASRTLTPKR
jgi:hypothetical protein